MKSTGSVQSADLSIRYWQDLIEGLALSEVFGGLVNGELFNQLQNSVDSEKFDRILKIVDDVENAAASAFNDRYGVAQVYPNMRSFWTDAKAQEQGLSPKTFWDTYEHGSRRILEASLATVYGAEEAVLVNSGMSALAVISDAANLRDGDLIFVPEQPYFETTELIEGLTQRGVVVETVSHSFASYKSAFARRTPKLVYSETVSNTPSVLPIVDIIVIAREYPETLFVIDNSVQGQATKWFSDLQAPANVVVVASAIKYITHRAMAGVIYGRAGALADIRFRARATGQLLQGRAFSCIRPLSVAMLDRKHEVYTRNTIHFARTLRASDRFRLVNTLNSRASETEIALFHRGVGSLVFIAFDEGDDLELFVDSWSDLAMREGLRLDIRAGFGWPRTSARSYHRTNLNSALGAEYVRVSVGLEPLPIITALAECAIRCA